MKKYEINVDSETNERLDSYVAKQIEKTSRTYVHKLIKTGLVLVNNKEVKPRYMVKSGDLIKVSFPEPKIIDLKPENIPLNIVYEDSDILVVNKPKGMVVHPAPGNESGTLVNALLYQIDNLSSENSDSRPGIVHRLDKDTSGLLVIAKSDMAYRSLLEQFKKRTVKRRYIALAHGNFNIEKATINAPIGRSPMDRKRMEVIDENSKEAITHYKVLQEFDEYALIETTLETGRTHQIRVHMSYIKHPIVGDQKYSRRKNEFKIKTQLLHANNLGFVHPISGEYIEFEAEVPKEFGKIIRLLEIRNR